MIDATLNLDKTAPKKVDFNELYNTPKNSIRAKLTEMSFSIACEQLAAGDGNIDDTKLLLDFEVAALGAVHGLGHEAIMDLRQEASCYIYAAQIWHELQDEQVMAICNSMAPPDDEIEFDFCQSELLQNEEAKHRVDCGSFSISRVSALDTSSNISWLIEGVIPTRGMILLYGPSGVGKSFAALDLAFAVTSGNKWASRDTLQGEVIYVAAEDAAGIKSRIAAIQKENEITDGSGPMLVQGAFNLSRGSSDCVELIKSLPGLAKKKVRLVVIDTLQMTLGDADENSASEATAIVKNCHKISDALNCAVVLVHHAGKDTTKKARGSSAYMGAADTIIFMSGTKKQKNLILQKQKNGPGDLKCVGELVANKAGTCSFKVLKSWSTGNESVADTNAVVPNAEQALLLKLMKDLASSSNSLTISRKEVFNLAAMLPEYIGRSQDACRQAINRAIGHLATKGYLSSDRKHIHLTASNIQ